MIRRALPLLLTLCFAAGAAAEPPRLVVVISLDQFRADYVTRFQPWFGKGGFNRFLDSGAVFTNANYLHATTITGPGHASIGTGRTPSDSGIVSNAWLEANAPYDAEAWRLYFTEAGSYPLPKDALAKRPAGTPRWYEQGGGAPYYCVLDPRVTPTAGSTEGMSPVRLASDSLTDRVKEHDTKSRVIAVALKDRAAILMGGRKADAAYWFDNKLPAFISSTYYAGVDPAVLRFNERIAGYLPASREWTESGFIPKSDLDRITFDPPESWPFKGQRYHPTFPHPVVDGRSLTYSPFASDLLLDFAADVIDKEKLGADRDPDLLFVGVSTSDYIGHDYGPDSREVADNVVRLDRALARFLDRLDAKFHGRVVVALTGDHGVQRNPDIARLRDPNFDGGRFDLRNVSGDAWLISQMPPLRIEIEEKLAAALKLPFDREAPIDHALVYFVEEPSLYLNWNRLRALGLDGEIVKNALRDVLSAMRDRGVDRAFTNSELMESNPNPPALERAARFSFRADRSGDVVVELRKNWLWTGSKTSATHGQPVADDQHVPLMLWGNGIRAGRYDDAVAPTDLARTLGVVLGVDAGGPMSHALPCVGHASGARATVTLVTPAATKTSRADADIEALFRAIADDVDPKREVRWVAGLRLAPEIAAAAGRVRPVVTSAELAQTLPRGTLRLDAIRIDGDTATVTVWRGPIPQPKPGELLLSCGTGTAYTFHREAGGQWVRVPGVGMMVC